MNWFTSLPLIAKIGLAIVVAVGLLLLALLVEMMTYTRADEKPLAQLACGANRLRLVLVVSRFVGGTRTNHRLYWNDKRVGSTEDRDEAGQPRTLPADPDDRGRVVIRAVAADSVGWTVWVDPVTFSRVNFDAMVNCLNEGREDLTRQMRQVDHRNTYDAPIGGYAETIQIGALVYGDNQAVSNRDYGWKSDWGETYELTVQPSGWVSLTQDFRTAYIGRVHFEAGKRRLTWRYDSDLLLTAGELAQFRSKQGERLTQRYTLEHDPDDNVLFVREAGNYSERMLMYRSDAPAYEANTASALVINRKDPLLNRSYKAGTITPGATGAIKPVFQYAPWPDHLLTEADLSSFRNERGQRLGDLYDLRPSTTNDNE